ncbi:MAG: hypothetical protein JSR67_17040 [Proteobacteria bacterium]|nr:hypothetical protein [Pseudomonadota bacterium]
MSVSLSAHARMRMQQRGISPAALQILFELGEACPAPGGGEVVYLDRADRGEVGRRARCIRGRDRVKRLYAVTDGHGTVITVGHRYRRIARI